MSLSELKLEIEKRLYYSDILFSTKIKTVEGKKYLYFYTKDQIGVLTIIDNKAKYLVADSKKLEWAIEEGFSQDRINQEFLVYELVKTMPTFIKRLSQKKVRKKTKLNNLE